MNIKPHTQKLRGLREFTVTHLVSNEFLTHASFNRRNIAKAFQNLC